MEKYANASCMCGTNVRTISRLAAEVEDITEMVSTSVVANQCQGFESFFYLNESRVSSSHQAISVIESWGIFFKERGKKSVLESAHNWKNKKVMIISKTIFLLFAKPNENHVFMFRFCFFLSPPSIDYPYFKVCSDKE